jgi:cupin 2 domain-containing protein
VANVKEEGGKGNIFLDLPDDRSREWFHDILRSPHVRIERIVSYGQSSPETGWYDQEEHEWVMVLEGSGCLLFDDGREVVLEKGDHLNIPARTRHKVLRTDPSGATVWLAVFYKN